jgi:tetratricopeptide (TPR) repeat protein
VTPLSEMATFFPGRPSPLPFLGEDNFSIPVKGEWASPSTGLVVLFAGLILLIGIPLVIFITLKIFRYIKVRREKGIIEEMLHQARKSEEAGKFVSAAFIYEKLKDFERSASLYEKGGDFARAAVVYESIGEMAKAREMSEKAGDLRKAAETCMSMGDYTGAARIFSQTGDKAAAAGAFEASGNRLAAVRMYREAKNYVKASMLLKEEGMLKESADMYRLSLAEALQASNLDNYYAYACLLEKAGDRDKASEIFRDILSIEPHFMDVREKLESLASTDDTDAVAPSSGEAERPGKDGDRVSGIDASTPLRNIMRSGRMEPRYSFRLWVQIVRALKNRYDERVTLGNLSPESIFIDSANNVSFDETIQKNSSYMSPEAIAGSEPDTISAIYSLGVILYEMLTGSLDSLTIKKPGEVAADIPPWLEEFSVKCIENNRTGRYGSIDEIFSSLKDLKNNL